MAVAVLGEEPAGLQMARWVVEHGGHVIPAYVNRECDKYPLVKGWQNAASRDPVVLEEWWTRYTYAGCGVVSRTDGWICFDLDGPEAVSWFRELCAGAGGTGTGCLVYKTPGRSGGVHIWYRWPPWLPAFHSSKYLERGGGGGGGGGGVGGWSGECQLRGVGSWTLLPCKRMDGEYELLHVPEGELEELPRKLWEAFNAEAAQCSVGGSSGGDLRELSPSEAWAKAPWTDGRKNCVAGLAWHEAIRGADYDSVLDTCVRFASECCLPELESGVVQRKVDYTWGRAQAALEKSRKEAQSVLGFIMNRGREQGQV